MPARTAPSRNHKDGGVTGIASSSERPWGAGAPRSSGRSSSAPAGAPLLPDTADVGAGAVSIWLSQRGERLWSVRVPLGANQDDVDRAVDVALAAEKRLEDGA